MISVLPPPMSATATFLPSRLKLRATLKNASWASFSAVMISDVQARLGLHAADEISSVGRFPHRARGDGLHFPHLKAGGDLLHVPQDRQRLLDRVGVEASCGGQSLAQTRRFLFFVQNRDSCRPATPRPRSAGCCWCRYRSPPADGPAPATDSICCSMTRVRFYRRSAPARPRVPRLPSDAVR